MSAPDALDARQAGAVLGMTGAASRRRRKAFKGDTGAFRHHVRCPGKTKVVAARLASSWRAMTLLDHLFMSRMMSASGGES